MWRRSIEFKSSTRAQQQLQPTSSAQNGQLSEHQATAKKNVERSLPVLDQKKLRKKQLDLWIGLRCCCCSRTRSRKNRCWRNKLTKCVKIVFKFHLRNDISCFVFLISFLSTFYISSTFLSRALDSHTLYVSIFTISQKQLSIFIRASLLFRRFQVFSVHDIGEDGKIQKFLNLNMVVGVIMRKYEDDSGDQRRWVWLASSAVAPLPCLTRQVRVREILHVKIALIKLQATPHISTTTRFIRTTHLHVKHTEELLLWNTAKLLWSD